MATFWQLSVGLLFWFAPFGTFAASVVVSATPSSDSCIFYDVLRNEWNCPEEDSNSYLKDYGQHYCSAFLAARSRCSPELEEWARKTALCLQEILIKNPERIGKCPRLSSFAYDVHPICYKEANVCKLKPTELFQIISVIESKDFLTRRALVQALNVIDCWLSATSSEERAVYATLKAEVQHNTGHSKKASEIFARASSNGLARRDQFKATLKDLLSYYSLSSQDSSELSKRIESYSFEQHEGSSDDLRECLSGGLRCPDLQVDKYRTKASMPRSSDQQEIKLNQVLDRALMRL